MGIVLELWKLIFICVGTWNKIRTWRFNSAMSGIFLNSFRIPLTSFTKTISNKKKKCGTLYTYKNKVIDNF